MSSTLTLSTIHPDQSDLLIQLEAYLNTQDSWKGIVTSQTGQGLMNMVAAVGAFNQAKIQRKFQDSFPETVVSDRAAYAMAAMQGVRLVRKQPASVQANLLSTGIALSIPAYTTFQGAGGFFFNREALFLPADTSVAVELHEGQVLRYSMPGIDQPYALFVSAEQAYTVSDTDVAILLNDAPMERTTGGVWTLQNQLGFGDSTLPDGKLMIQFGNSKFGGQPGANDTLYLTYVTTNGADGNSLDCLGKGFTAPDYSNLAGRFTSNPTGGSDERPALSYKNVASPNFGTFDSAVTKQQHISTALKFPGVVDVISFAQREVNPSALEWMNVILLVPYTSTPWDDSIKADFLAYMQKNCVYAPHFILGTPVPINLDIVLEIYCYNWANSSQAKLNAEAAAQALFVPRIGMLNYDMHLSDITGAAKKSDPGIEYVILKSPTEDVLISGSPLPAPTLTVAPLVGNLPPDTYYYGVQVTTSQGIIAVRNLAQVSVSTLNNAITIHWEKITDAVSYQVYRKDTLSLRPGLIADVSATSPLTFVDTNQFLPGVVPSPQNTVPVRYVVLNSLLTTDFYSTRGIRN